MRKDNNMGKLSTNIADEHQYFVNLKSAQKPKLKSKEKTSSSSNEVTAVASSSSTTTIIRTTTIPSTVTLSPLLSIISNKNILTINLDEEKLAYRAEGNANLVLSLPHTKQVLRLRKTDINEIISAETNEILLKTLQESIEYTQFMTKLFGANFTYQPELVYLNLCSLDTFNKWLLKYRPVHRLDKEIRCRYGILYPDVAFLPTSLLPQKDTESKANVFCVEIKPKQGWTFYEENHLNNFQQFEHKNIVKCRFCCMQYLKLRKGSIRTISRYCPIDLFSGDADRMKNAIRGLISSPQNNFRIFKNGKLIFGDKTNKICLYQMVQEIFGTQLTLKERMNYFLELLIGILLKDFSIVDKCKRQPITELKLFKVATLKTSCEPISSQCLSENCVLKKILDIQLLAKKCLEKQINFNETDQPYSYISNLVANFNLAIPASRANTINVDKIRAEAVMIKKSCTNNVENNEKLTEINEKIKLMSNEEQYLIGATALDCSVLISFQRITDDAVTSDNAKNIINLNRIKFLTKVAVMDLDPKATNHFSKYIRQTNASHLAYNEYKSS